MDYIIENEYLKVTVTTAGAQVKSVRRKCDGAEHIWQADPNVWGWYGPILFPHCGKVVDGIIEAKGAQYPSGQHGFARNMEHSFLRQTETELVLSLESSPETLAKWPYEFKLLSTFTLAEDSLHHSLTVENPGSEPLRFGIGYHPAYCIPFDADHSAGDYVLKFDKPQSPTCIGCLPLGLVHGNCYKLGSNLEEISINEALFANDRHCMAGLSAKTLGIYEQGTGRAVFCDIEEFPYTLIWSKPGVPRFVCIEPWHSLPSWENGSKNWDEKPAAAILQPGQRWTTTLKTRFQR